MKDAGCERKESGNASLKLGRERLRMRWKAYQSLIIREGKHFSRTRFYDADNYLRVWCNASLLALPYRREMHTVIAMYGIQRAMHI